MTTSDTERPENSPSQLVAAPIALTRQLEQLVDKRINILRRIHETGSISEAARLSNVSYKAAWQALETLTNLAGVPLVEKEVGGSKGGGTKLTAAGNGPGTLRKTHAGSRIRPDAIRLPRHPRTCPIEFGYLAHLHAKSVPRHDHAHCPRSCPGARAHAH